MQTVWSVALQAMQQDASKLDRIASNLSNILTVGYKREVAMQRPVTAAAVSFQQALSQQADDVSSRGAGMTPSQMATGIESARDQRPGTLKPTGQSLDLALVGPGYFEVLTVSGPAYTRQGQWALDGRGRLVTAGTGHPLMGRGGEIQLVNAQFTVDAKGNVTQDGRVVGQVKVMAVDSGSPLRALGEGLFATDGVTHELGDADVQMRQGFVENSNVQPMQEMLQLIQTMRHFESMHRIAQGYDDMLGIAIRKLGEL